MSRFTDKVVIVTGSSNGIGRTTAVLFAKEGAKVTITGRNGEKLEETCQEILKCGGKLEDVNIVIGDIVEDEVQAEIVKSTLQRFGKLDILINNAGAAFADQTGKEGSQAGIEYFDRSIQLNLRSVIELVQKCRPHLIANKGEIVNVSTIASGPQPWIPYSFYGIAKAGLNQFSRTIALELIEHGVRVNAVNPGLIETGFLKAFGVEDSNATKMRSFYTEHRDCIPAGTAGTPEDVALLIAFLADRKSSSFIIGQSIVIDGGTSLVLAMASRDLSKVLA